VSLYGNEVGTKDNEREAMKKAWIYLAGVALLGLVSGLKSTPTGPMFFGGAIL